MKVRGRARTDRPATGKRTVSSSWGPAASALAAAGFALALALSYRALGNPRGGDLRTPGVLAVDALLATAIGLGYAAQRGTLATAGGWWWSAAFGLWSAAVFRLAPPIMNETVLYNRNLGSLDVPYVLVGAAIHGGIAVLLISPYAGRVVTMNRGASGEAGESWQVGGASVLAFLIVAAVVRVATGLRL